MTRLVIFVVLAISVYHVSCICKAKNEYFDLEKNKCTLNQHESDIIFIGHQVVTLHDIPDISKNNLKFKINYPYDGPILYTKNNLHYLQWVYKNNDLRNENAEYSFFNERSCCANIEEIFNFETKKCEKISNVAKNAASFIYRLTKFLNVKSNGNKWMSAKGGSYVDYVFPLSSFTQIDKKIEIVLKEHDKIIWLDLTKDNKNYCFDMRKNQIFLRVLLENNCVGNDCIKTCGRTESDSEVSFTTSYRIQNIKEAFKEIQMKSKGRDITMQDYSNCKNGYVKITDFWKFDNKKNLVIKDKIIQKDNHCFDINAESVSVHVCRDSVNELPKLLEVPEFSAEKLVLTSSTESPIEKCNKTNCFRKCYNFKDVLGQNFTIGSKNETTRTFDVEIDSFTGDFIENSLVCPDGYKKIVEKYSAKNKNELVIHANKYTVKEFCLFKAEGFETEVELYFCIAKSVTNAFQKFYNQQASELGLYIGIAVILLVICLIVILYKPYKTVYKYVVQKRRKNGKNYYSSSSFNDSVGFRRTGLVARKLSPEIEFSNGSDFE